MMISNDIFSLRLLRRRCPACETMDAAIRALAAKRRNVKFCRIPHRECVKDYPDRLTPTLLVYRDRDVAKSFATLAPFGGARMTPENVELALRGVDSRAFASPDGDDDVDGRAAYIATVIARIADVANEQNALDDDALDG